MRILLIEDEKHITEFLKPALEAERFEVDWAQEGEKGLFLGTTNQYDLVIVDNMLPKMTGVEICKALRQGGKTMPILILSVLADASKKAELLNGGADDYLTKPFAFEELLARVRALLRRPQPFLGDTLQVGDLVLDTVKHTITRSGRSIHLTPKEFSLLEYLIRNRGAVVSRGMILEHVWDMNADPFSNTVEAHILSLRKKIDAPKLIQTVHGLGYKIE